MDPRHRADEALARARARGAFVVTPDNATSPMDSSSTVRIPRETVDGADRDELDPESTVVLPQATAADDNGVTWPPAADPGQELGDRTHETGQDPSGSAMPPNPYQSRRGPGEFGPLGSQATQQYPHR